MQPVDRTDENRNLWGIFLLCAIVLICYSNNFNAGWHLDDYPNIISNTRLHVDVLTFDALKQSFTALPSDPGNKIWRPLPCLSLALNWYWGEDDPIGYHGVNLILHMIVACVLFLTVKLLLQTPAVKADSTPGSRHIIALLAASLWAVNPIQTQAVTYIIQRMAVMAAMFSILGLYAYLRGRLTVGRERWGWFSAVAAFFVCALLSKENAVLFPFSVLLIEFIFFMKRLPMSRTKAWLTTRNGLIAGFLLIAVIAFIVLNTAGNPINFGYYDKRPFSLWERLLSQPRILFFYLSLLFYPAPWRFSIEHEINHSLSLFTPWTTFPAIFGVVGLIGVATLTARKRPLLSFGIFFFFLNHLVESTILPLELVFEHRNYLPSFFIFLPVAYWFNQLVVSYRRENTSIFIMLVVLFTVILTATGLGCYDRNKAWKTDYSLWYDAFQKAPGRARSLMALGVAIGWGEEDIPNKHDIALGIFNRALKLPGARKNETAQIYGNLGLIHMARGEWPQAIAAYHKALEISPNERKIRFDLVRGLIALGRWHESEKQIDILLADEFATPSELSYKGFVNLWLKKPENALRIFQEVLASDYRDAFVYHNIGVAMARLDYPERGKWFLERALEIVEKESRGRIIIYLTLMENRHMDDDVFGAKDATYRLLAEYGLDEILDTLRLLPATHNYPPMDTEAVSRILSRNLVDIAQSVDAR
ncbi:MAG: tetratricopeptide repeat protein [Desulfosarcina sp.]|nr:tetratricopeptide repeat protein [Desulfosarcina sp.]